VPTGICAFEKQGGQTSQAVGQPRTWPSSTTFRRFRAPALTRVCHQTPPGSSYKFYSCLTTFMTLPLAASCLPMLLSQILLLPAYLSLRAPISGAYTITFYSPPGRCRIKTTRGRHHPQRGRTSPLCCCPTALLDGRCTVANISLWHLLGL